MNSKVSGGLPNRLSTPDERHIHNAYAATIALILVIIPTLALFGYSGFSGNQWQFLVIAGALLVALIVDLGLIPSIQHGRSNLAMMILTTSFIITALTITIFTQGLGVTLAVATIFVVIAISNLAMPPRYAMSGVIVAALAGLGLFLLDARYAGNRLAIPQVEIYAPYIIAVLGLGFIFLGIREFNKLSLQIKIALGMLVTGAVTVTVLAVFGINRSNTLTTYLLSQYKSSNNDSIKQQVVKQAKSTADQTNALFAMLVKDINIISDYRANLEEQKETFSQGAYWDAKTRLTQLPGGQYGNPITDPASIFIPSTVNLNEDILADLNTTAYFDFYALNYLKSHPEVAAVYFMSKSGATTYYPNIGLASSFSSQPGFDPRTQPFYTIVDPAKGAGREPSWVPAYRKPGGQGLFVTLSSPVYSNDKFLGVMGIDVQLEYFSKQIANIQIGQTGYAFLVDQKGHILAMPAEGYALFGMQPEDIPINESPKQSIVGKGTPELQQAVTRMLNSLTGSEVVPLNNENLHVAFAPLFTPNYRLGIVVPEKEFTENIVASENETQKQVQSTLQGMTVILIFLFVGAVTVSLSLGQIITRPLLHLTNTVEQIAGGDFSARVKSETQDETGVLANSFNIMTEALSNTLAGLEERISERTRELEKVNEGNARRAAQFESIAHVARTVSSTQTLDMLLPQIAETISLEFNFYHVGIFLLDSRREFAILVAANSEGGKRMLERNHRLHVGETGIVGYVTNIGQPRVALDVGVDAAYFNNPDLPDTHSEVALPLRVGADVFGALDVQSTEPNAFAQEDISILSTLADQVSIAIQNARSYQQSSEALIQAENASLQLSGQQWKRFLANQTMEGFYFDGVDTKAVTPAIKQRPHSLAIPLTLRGSQIGSIKLSALDPSREWSDDEISMIQAAAERTALALENARLLLESQKRASKERTIGEISARIGGSVNLESILQTAIQELGNTLPGVDVAVQFTDTLEKQ